MFSFDGRAPLAPLTHKNHLRYHFEGSSIDVPNGQTLIVELGPCSLTGLTLIEEGVRAAKLIHSSANSPLWLCTSGGIDSEAMARCFLAAKVPFKVAILRFPDRLNWYDIRAAVQFCDQHDIDFEFFDLDILEFLKSGAHMEIARAYRCRSPQLAAHIQLMRMVPGFPVFAWNIPHIHPQTDASSRAAILLPTDHYFCYHRFFQAERREGVAFFFAYTPELIYTALQLPEVQQTLFSPQRQAELTYRSKILALNEGGLPVRARKGKRTGYERVREHFANHSGGSDTTFDELYRKPMEALFPEPSPHVFKLDTAHIRTSAHRDWT